MATTELVDRDTGEIEGAEERVDVARVDPRFIQMRQGRPFVAYPGLLDLLHQLSEGYFSVETDVVQLPSAENGQVAVVQARVRIFDSQDADIVRRTTTGLGDADPSNVGKGMHLHLLRLAETRAKARALRDAVNVGMAALEELGPEEPVERRDEPRASVPAPAAQHIVVEGRTFSRDEVTAAYLKRMAQAEAAGLAVEQHVVDPGHLARLPLSVIVGQSQDLKRRLEAKAQASAK